MPSGHFEPDVSSIVQHSRRKRNVVEASCVNETREIALI
jgi:hypothetical protein